MESQDAYSTAEIARSLGVSRQAVDSRAKRESWPSVPRVGRGGGNMYPVATLPKEVRDSIIAAQLADNGVALPALPGWCASTDPRKEAASRAGDLSQLSQKDRETALARLAFVREIERLSAITGKESAIRHLVEAAQAETLGERLAQFIPVANAKYGAGAGRGLSRRRLYEWCALHAEGGALALAPRTPHKDMSVPAWAPLFLFYYQRPQNPSLAEAHRDFTRAWQAEQPSRAPSIDAVRRWLAKVAKPDLQAGRKTGNALLHLKPFLKRKTDKLLPCDVYTADGTTFDAEIAHPDTGRPFKPEVVLFLDVCTRRCVGLSVALAESAAATLDALRMACLFGGIPAMLYTDNGPGYTADLLTKPGVGMLGRLGIEIANAIPGRPQGKGLMERAVKTICVPASKQLATCTHADMDGDAKQNVYKITRAQLKKHGYSALLPTFEQFKKVLLARVEEYNASPHRGLPIIEDVAAGKRRHMSPNESWESFAGMFEPYRVPEDLRDDLFMPGTVRKVKNGMVRLWNRDYFASELAAHHDDIVQVRYDIWDASYVTVWTEAGEKLCTAKLDANAMDYFPISRIEEARANRERAQLKRLEKKAQAIAPGASITAPADATALMADSLSSRRFITVQAAQAEPVPSAPTSAELERIRTVMAEAEQEAAQALAPKPAPEKRPIFHLSTDKYRWLLRHQDQWTDADRAWLAEFAQGSEFAMLRERFEYEGLVLTPAQLSPALETPGL